MQNGAPAAKSVTAVELVHPLLGPALLLVILLIANFNIVFLGQSLVATANSNPITDAPGTLRPGLFHGGSSSVNWHDVGGVWWQWEPAGKLMARAFRQGHVPMWDSSVGGGVDSHVNMIQTQYYPPYIALLLAGDTPLLRDLYYLAELYISGLFCYLLLRAHGCHWLSAVCMGTVQMLSGAMVQNVNSSIGQTFAVLPLMVWSIDLVLRRCSWRTVGASAFLLALAASSSFLPAVISGYLLVGIYITVALAWPGQKSERWIRGMKASAAVLLSIAMLAFLLIPVELASRQDQTFAHWYYGVGLQHYSFDAMLALISPSVSFDVWQLGNPAAHLFWQPHSLPPFYIGLIPILLAFLALGKLDARFHQLRVFFAFSAAFLFLKLIGAIPVQWLGLLPVFRDIHFIHYFCGALTFSFAGLAGLGVEGIIQRRNPRTIAIGCLSLLAIALIIVRFDQTESTNTALQGAALWSAVARYGLEIVRLTLLAVSFLAVVLLSLRIQNGPLVGFLLIAMVCLDLIPLSEHERFLRADIWEEPPDFVRFLQADRTKFRVGTDIASLQADVSQALGLDVLSSRMAFNSSRYSDILHKYLNAPDLPYPLAYTTIPTNRVVFDLLNVKYLLLHTPDDTLVKQVTAAGLIPVFQSPLYRIYRNQQAWSRAYIASALRVENKPESELADLATLRPGDVLLEEQPEAVPVAGDAAIVDLRYDFDKIAVRAHTSHSSVLVLDENYSPGWHATIAGKPVRIYRANYAFQAVAIPSGDSEIRFAYTPEGLHLGVVISILAASIALLLRLIPSNTL